MSTIEIENISTSDPVSISSMNIKMTSKTHTPSSKDTASHKEPIFEVFDTGSWVCHSCSTTFTEAESVGRHLYGCLKLAGSKSSQKKVTTPSKSLKPLAEGKAPIRPEVVPELNSFVCKLCLQAFPSVVSLIVHNCTTDNQNIMSDFSCVYCSRRFHQPVLLRRHQSQCPCRNKCLDATDGHQLDSQPQIEEKNRAHDELVQENSDPGTSTCSNTSFCACKVCKEKFVMSIRRSLYVEPANGESESKKKSKKSKQHSKQKKSHSHVQELSEESRKLEALKIQKENHSRKTPKFKCDSCVAAFHAVPQLLGHRLIHTNDGKYWCKVCRARFRSRSSYSAHKRTTHHSSSSLKCEFCFKEFLELPDLLRHQKRKGHEAVQERRTYPCALCPVVFALPGYLKQHYAKIHGDESPVPPVVEPIVTHAITPAAKFVTAPATESTKTPVVGTNEATPTPVAESTKAPSGNSSQKTSHVKSASRTPLEKPEPAPSTKSATKMTLEILEAAPSSKSSTKTPLLNLDVAPSTKPSSKSPLENPETAPSSSRSASKTPLDKPEAAPSTKSASKTPLSKSGEAPSTRSTSKTSLAKTTAGTPPTEIGTPVIAESAAKSVIKSLTESFTKAEVAKSEKQDFAKAVAKSIAKSMTKATSNPIAKRPEKPDSSPVSEPPAKRIRTVKYVGKYVKTEKEFSCSVCQKAFFFHSLLKVHMKYHTSTHPYECTVCGEKVRTASLLRHHTCNLKYKCSMCPAKFAHERPLRCHLGKEHPVEDEDQE